MAISYNSDTDFNKSLQNTGKNIDVINRISPSVDYGSLSNGLANNGISSFGMSPDEVTSQFNSAYAGANAGYSPFPDSGVKDRINLIKDQYDQVPQAYDVSGTINSLNQARKRNLLTGEQAANTSAQKFQESQQPGSANNIGAGVLRSQQLLPFLKQDSADAVDAGKYADKAKQDAVSQATSIASTLAQLEQTYTNSLASYNANKASFALDYANKQSGLALDSSQKSVTNYLDYYKTQAQVAENARQANLSASLKNREMDLNAAQTANSQKITAANSYLSNAKAPTGYWTTDNSGKVTSGNDSYAAYQDYLSGKSNVLSNLSSLV